MLVLFSGVNDRKMKEAIEDVHNKALSNILKSDQCEKFRKSNESINIHFSKKVQSTAVGSKKDATRDYRTCLCKFGYSIVLNWEYLKDNPEDIPTAYLHKLAYLICNIDYDSDKKRWTEVMRLLKGK